MLNEIRKRLWRARNRARLAEQAFPPREFVVPLPAGYPARSVAVRLSVPPLLPKPALRFSDHVVEANGKVGRTLLATMPGGFAISQDLGARWRHVVVEGHKHHRFVHVRALGGGEYLAQVRPPGVTRETLVDLLVIDESGKVLSAHVTHGVRWHGCRAIDQAAGTLMYAEYPSEGPQHENIGSRVLRSRDRGRHWEVVYAQAADQIRHFHFLQARPGKPGEWWLTSGDQPEESHIWVSKDDGDTWHDVTGGRNPRVSIDGEHFPRSIFRLTDLAWQDDEVVWGSDDILWRAGMDLRGGHMFRSNASKVPLEPQDIGSCRWQIRSMVDVGDFYLVLTQGSTLPNATAEERMPEALLMPKKRPPSGPGLFPLFAIDTHTDKPLAGAGFTYSKASRAAVDGTFFTFRAPFHVFPSGHQILRWDIRFS